ncbi:MAG: aldehyde dehydrogenase family protein, partial [Nannocystaceae bacterium]
RWDVPASARAEILERAADLYEEEHGQVFALLAREAGKTLPDAVGELREAVLERELPLSTVLPVLTSNVAALLRLPGKGRLQVGADADLLVLGPDLQLRSVVAGGRFHLRDGEIVQRGPFG